jgi:hypothetical protein
VDFKQLDPDEIDTIVRSLYSLIEYNKYQQLVKVMEGVDGRCDGYGANSPPRARATPTAAETID